MAQFEADLADENANDDEVAEEKPTKQGGEEAWLKSDRDYAYDEVNSIYSVRDTSLMIV
jgi:translation initiation factor 2 subunit 2